MTDLIVGSGSVGSLLAWALSTSGRDVAVVRRAHAGPPASSAIAVIDRTGERRPAPVTTVASPGDLDAAPAVIVFAVKMYDLAEAAESCAAWPGSPALTVQNGIGAEEIVSRRRPSAPVIAGSLTASIEPAGEAIRWLTRGGLGLAPVHGSSETVIASVARAFDAAGLRTRHYRGAGAMKWSKLLANLVANATGAILDLPAEQIYRRRDLFEVERRQLLEALGVMKRLRLATISLPGANVSLLAFGMRLPSAVSQPVMRRVVGGARGGKDPSLRLRLRSADGPSEVDWLNGAVVTAGSRLGLQTPINRRLTELVHEVLADPERRAWFRMNPERLLQELGR